MATITSSELRLAVLLAPASGAPLTNRYCGNAADTIPIARTHKYPDVCSGMTFTGSIDSRREPVQLMKRMLRDWFGVREAEGADSVGIEHKR